MEGCCAVHALKGTWYLLGFGGLFGVVVAVEALAETTDCLAKGRSHARQARRPQNQQQNDCNQYKFTKSKHVTPLDESKSLVQI